MEPNRLPIKGVLQQGYSIFKAQWKFFVVFGAVLFVLRMLAEYIQSSADMGIGSLVGLIRWVVEMYMGLVFVNVALRAVDGEVFSIQDFRSVFPSDVQTIKRYILTSLLTSLIVFAGLLLLIVPGIIWGLMYGFAIYVAVDQEVGAREALRRSRSLTKGNRLRIGLLGLLSGLINLGGAMLLGVGLLVSMPITLLAGAAAYRFLQQGEDGLPESPRPVEDKPTSVQPVNSGDVSSQPSEVVKPIVSVPEPEPQPEPVIPQSIPQETPQVTTSAPQHADQHDAYDPHQPVRPKAHSAMNDYQI